MLKEYRDIISKLKQEDALAEDEGSATGEAAQSKDRRSRINKWLNQITRPSNKSLSQIDQFNMAIKTRTNFGDKPLFFSFFK